MGVTCTQPGLLETLFLLSLFFSFFLLSCIVYYFPYASLILVLIFILFCFVVSFVFVFGRVVYILGFTVV